MRGSQIGKDGSSLLAPFGGLAAIGLMIAVLVVIGRPLSTHWPSRTSTPIASSPAATPSPTPAGAWITLAPVSGPPGSTVEIRGYLPNGPSSDQVTKDPSLGDATVCWTDCLSGLKEQAVPVRWSPTEPGHFTMQLRVPSVPWLAANGPHALAPGDYLVGIQCLAPELPKSKGPGFVPCAEQPAQATATFHLTGPVPTLCANRPCARMSFSPANGPPGTLVQIHGWAPLTQLIGVRPQGYSLVLHTGDTSVDHSSPAREKATAAEASLGQVQQDLNGNLSGSFQVPMSLPSFGQLGPGVSTLALQAFIPSVRTFATPVAGATVTSLGGTGVAITFAPTPFTVTAAQSWASLGRLAPLWSAWSARWSSAGLALVGDPTNPRRLAYCTAGGIRASSDGGSTWATIPTAGAISAVAATPFQFFQSGAVPPSCSGVVLDPSHPRSFFATFAVVKKNQGPPPENLIGLVTTDDGQSWRAVPVPAGAALDRFGGFRARGRAVQALFEIQNSASRFPPFTAQQTTDGGNTWAPSQLGCPAAGPCVQWGPAPSFVGGMGANYPQAIIISEDGGANWAPPAWPSQVDDRSGPSELVALSSTDIALVSGAAPYPFVVSHDGGQTWEDVALPGLGPASDGVAQYPELQMLPNGNLLTRGPNPSYPWLMLSSGASQWCRVTGGTLPSSFTSFQAIGDRLWWVREGSTLNQEPTVGSVAVSDLRCGQAVSTVYLSPTPTATPVIAPATALQSVLDSPGVKGSSLFAIFPRKVTKQPCTIHGGGSAPGITVQGVCLTMVEPKGSLDEVDFVEGWNAADFHAAGGPSNGWLTHTWIFVVDRQGKIEKQSEIGSFPPQAAK